MTRIPLSAWLAPCLAIAAGCAAPTVPPSPLDHPAVSRYVAGWQAQDGRRVASAFGPDGRYRDPSLPADLDVAGLAAHVADHPGARFELQGARQIAPDRIELRWKAVWPRPAPAVEHVDALQLAGTAIARVDSTVSVPAEARALVAAYEGLHDAPTPERMQALLTPDVEVHGSSLPAGGLRYEAFATFLQTLRGTTFRQRPEVPLAMTKDGRIVMHWTLTAGSRRLAAGTDHLTVEQGRIRKIVGVY